MNFEILKLNYFDDEVLAVSADYFAISPNISKRFDKEINYALDKLVENPLAYFNIDIKPYRRIVVRSFPFAIIYRVEGNLVYVMLLFPLRDDPEKLFKKSNQ
jgi:plasmid stabilization system protein ParE